MNRIFGVSGGLPTSCAIMVLVAFLAVSCSGKIGQKDLVGPYSLALPSGKHVLTLNSNGEWVQEVRLRGSPQNRRAQGTWKFDPATQYVTLDGNFVTPFVTPYPLKVALGTNYLAVLHAERGLGGGLRLIADEDHAYRKETQQ